MIKNYDFYIHYCNGGKLKETGKFVTEISRSLPHHELIFISNGSGSFWIKDRKYPFKKGMLLYVTPNVPFSLKIDAKNPVACYTVHFSCASISFNDGKFDIKNETRMLDRRHVLELKGVSLIQEQFERLSDIWHSKVPGYEFIAKTMLQQIIIAIPQNIAKNDQNNASSLKVEKIIQFMQQNIQNKVTIRELSKMVQMSEAYLSKSFKENTGYTIIEYFTKLKIDKSKELLIEGNKKVKEVSQELGFNDEFYFSRVFKRIEGINPSEFCDRNVHAN
jgi:AraC family transcriptional regulator, transcriptional activator for feuABC-ybbA operon